MRERDFNPGLIEGLFDQFWHSETHIEPVPALNKGPHREVDRTVIQGRDYDDRLWIVQDLRMIGEDFF